MKLRILNLKGVQRVAGKLGRMVKARTSDKAGRQTTLAAGCVVYRRGDNGVELLIAHRPKYDDWSFPKGHVEKGEAELDAAIRETEEEVNARGTIETELPTIYRRVKGKNKRVRWWLMAYQEGEFLVNDEVDKIDWVTIDDVETRLTYPNDASLLPYVYKALGLMD